MKQLKSLNWLIHFLFIILLLTLFNQFVFAEAEPEAEEPNNDTTSTIVESETEVSEHSASPHLPVVEEEEHKKPQENKKPKGKGKGYGKAQPATIEMIIDIFSIPRVWMGYIFGIIGLILLMTNKLKNNIRTISLALIFFTFGVLTILPLGEFAKGMGLHPSPICMITKPFIFMKMGRSYPLGFFILFVFVAVLSVIGNKFFCGWVCPIGALQGLMNKIPLPSKYKIKLPFVITNSIRIIIYVIFFLLIIFTKINIYEYLNAFEILHWTYDLLGIIIIAIVLIASLFIYRPFCYLICPLGFLTWLLEHISLIRVEVDMEKCAKCDICIEDSPCPSMPAILDKKISRPDCHSCGRCIELCPTNALSFKFRGK